MKITNGMVRDNEELIGMLRDVIDECGEFNDGTHMTIICFIEDYYLEAYGGKISVELTESETEELYKFLHS